VPDDADLVISETSFDRDHSHRNPEHEELEVEIDFNVTGGDLTSLILNADERAAEIAQGREHYIWRIRADEEGGSLSAEATMYVMVPRLTRVTKRRAALGDN
jgi:hypothetical protein